MSISLQKQMEYANECALHYSKIQDLHDQMKTTLDKMQDIRNRSQLFNSYHRCNFNSFLGNIHLAIGLLLHGQGVTATRALPEMHFNTITSIIDKANEVLERTKTAVEEQLQLQQSIS